MVTAQRGKKRSSAKVDQRSWCNELFVVLIDVNVFLLALSFWEMMRYGLSTLTLKIAVCCLVGTSSIGFRVLTWNHLSWKP